ncbi:MAG: ATP synthase subunit I [Clostridia bacterium]|nr:ATP synthase subunit I [Clostridia bacterium]
MILKNVDATVKRETLYIAAAVGVMSLLLQSVFLIAQRWDYTVLLGNLLSAAAVIVNFFFMGLTVQRSLDKDEKDAVTAVKFSQQIRLLMMFVVVALGAALPCFNLYAVIIPLFFPRIAVALRPKFGGQTGE